MASGAHAADLPVKAKPVEYVKVCSAYGAGFYYIPGTDICLKVGGFVRADFNHNADQSFPHIALANYKTRRADQHQFHTRVQAVLDARQNTAYGTLRAYFNVGWNYVGGATTTAPAGATGGIGNTAGLGIGSSIFANFGYIQWAGFTFGRAASFFDFFGATGPYANLVNWGASPTGAAGHNVIAYTADFGGGVSGTISLEDKRYKAIITTTPTIQSFAGNTGTNPTTGSGNVRAGISMPALVGNVRVNQSWGSAQVMAAIQELRANGSVNANDTYGWAVGGGFTWNNPSAPGSQFGINVAYAEGAAAYVANSYGAHFMASGGTGSIGILVDGVVVNGKIRKVKTWGVNAGYQHRFSPNWAASLHGGYNDINYPGVVNAVCMGQGGSCNFDFWSLGSRLLWTPVPGLDLSVDVLYHKFGTQLKNHALASSKDIWSAQFRAIRNF